MICFPLNFCFPSVNCPLYHRFFKIISCFLFWLEDMYLTSDHNGIRKMAFSVRVIYSVQEHLSTWALGNAVTFLVLWGRGLWFFFSFSRQKIERHLENENKTAFYHFISCVCFFSFWSNNLLCKCFCTTIHLP